MWRPIDARPETSCSARSTRPYAASRSSAARVLDRARHARGPSAFARQPSLAPRLPKLDTARRHVARDGWRRPTARFFLPSGPLDAAIDHPRPPPPVLFGQRALSQCRRSNVTTTGRAVPDGPVRTGREGASLGSLRNLRPAASPAAARPFFPAEIADTRTSTVLGGAHAPADELAERRKTACYRSGSESSRPLQDASPVPPPIAPHNTQRGRGPPAPQCAAERIEGITRRLIRRVGERPVVPMAELGGFRAAWRPGAATQLHLPGGAAPGACRGHNSPGPYRS